MESSQVAVTHFLPLTRIRRARLLPVNGKVLVRIGQKVTSTDVIAQAEQGNGHVLIDLRRGLQLRRNERLEDLLERRIGDRLQAGDILAQKSGLFRRVVRTPVSGQLVAVTGGQALLEKAGQPLEICAGFSGTVIELIADRGAIIETYGGLVQGVWGNGRIEQGMLMNLAQTADEELTPAKLDVSLRGSIVMGGFCSQVEVFKTAAMLPLRGIILASMTSNLLSAAAEINFPVILTEGFGKIPMNPTAFQVLSTNAKRDINLNAAPWDLFSGERPEIVIPLPSTGEFPREANSLEQGRTVRVTSGPFASKTGTISEIKPGLTPISNKLRVPAATVRLVDSSEEILVPLANLDLIE
jgi:hypothetical protein